MRYPPLCTLDYVDNSYEYEQCHTEICTHKSQERPVLGLLAVKKGGLYEASKLLKMAAQEFKSEHISNGEEEIDCSYLLNRELDFDDDESDINEDV